jgi:hypothetical protein
MPEETDLKNMSLHSLYELMSFKIEEYKAVKNLYGNHQEVEKEIELLQKIIDIKKVKPINYQRPS